MKMTKFSWVGPLVITLLLFGNVTFSAMPVLTNDQLLEEGIRCYHQSDYDRAAMYLYAYIQRNPPLLKSNPEHAEQVEDALSWSLGNRVAQAKGDDGYPKPIPKPKLTPAAGFTPPPPPWRTEGLTGVWKSQHGITYYIRQKGNMVWWYAESADGGRTWAHVFHGTMSGDRLRGRFADIPKGELQNSGSLEIKKESAGYLKLVGGGFSEAFWTRPVSNPKTHKAPPAGGKH
jgi:hypothetical protein